MKISIEFISAFSSIILSVVAIFISIFTAKKQNNIALFNIRFTSVMRLKQIVGYANGIKNLSRPKELLYVFNSSFKCSISPDFIGNETITEVMAVITGIRIDVFAAQYVLDKKKLGRADIIINDLEACIVSCIENNDFEEYKKTFIEDATSYNDKYMLKLDKSIKL